MTHHTLPAALSQLPLHPVLYARRHLQCQIYQQIYYTFVLLKFSTLFSFMLAATCNVKYMYRKYVTTKNLDVQCQFTSQTMCDKFTDESILDKDV